MIDLDTFRDKVKAVAREMGVECDKLNITYTEHGFTFRGIIYDGEAGRMEEFARVALVKFFPSDWYGMVFNSKGVDYKITGANMRGHKYPIKAVRVSDGAAFKFPVSTVSAGNPLNVVAAPLQIESIT